MKGNLKYYLAKFFVLLLAVRILDVSIDVDFATASLPACVVESHDDIDSFSEFIFEKLFDNDHLFAESDDDDHHHDSHRLAAGNACVFYYVPQRHEIKEPAVVLISIPRTYAFKNVALFFEDHSHALYIPPDPSAIS